MVAKQLFGTVVGALVALAATQGCALEGAPEMGIIEQGIHDPPMNVVAVVTGPDRILVSWDAPTTGTKLYVYESESGGAYAFAGTTLFPGTSLVRANREPGTTYCYQVVTDGPEGASTPSSPPACATLPGAGIQGSWDFEEGSGTSAEDDSGWSHDGELTGNVTFTTDTAPIDDNRFALAFGGASGDAVSIADELILRLPSDFSIVLWAKLDAAPAGTLRLIGKRVAGCGTTNWELAQNADDQLHLRGAGVASFGQSLPVGRWTHVAVTHSGGTARLHLDGVEVASAPFTTGARNSSPLEIGNSGGCGSAPVVLDRVAVYTRALATAEIASLGTRPDAPANLVATAVSAKRVELSWDEVPGASKYLLYKGTTSGDQVFFTTVRAPTLSFADVKNQPNTSTSWFVRSVQNKMISDNSNEQIVTTLPPPPAPTSVAATAVSSSRIHVTWDAVAGASKYYVYQSTAGSPFMFRGTVQGTSSAMLSVAGLTPATEYTYYIVSYDGVVVSEPSATASATTLP